MYTKEEKRAFWTAKSIATPFNAKAHRKWGKEAEWISGDAPFASLAYCRVGGWHNSTTLTIELYRTLEECVLAQHNLCCGGQYCTGGNQNNGMHQIWDMSCRGYKRINKDKFYSDAPANTILRPEYQQKAVNRYER